jgi:hypothetical protein
MLEIQPLLWVAQQLDHLLPALVMPRKENIEASLDPEFHCRFPSLKLTDYLSHCMKERKRALEALSHFPGCRGPDGTIIVAELVKKSLAANPTLSDGTILGDVTEEAYLSVHRQKFCNTVCRVVQYVNGLQIFPASLEAEVATLQRHLLTHSPTAVFHPPRDFWNQFLHLLLAAFHFNDPTTSEAFLDSYGYEILGELREMPEDQVPLGVYQHTAALMSLSPAVMWPDLIGHDDFIHDLIEIFLIRSGNLGLAIDEVSKFISLSHELPVCESFNAFFAELDKQLKRDSCGEFICLFGGSETRFYRHVAKARLIRAEPSLEEQLWFFVANHPSFKADHRHLPPRVLDLVDRVLKKRWLETGGTPDQLACHSKNLLGKIAYFAHRYDIDEPENRQRLQFRAKLCAEQSDMVWRTLPSEIKENTIKPFEMDSPLLNSLSLISARNCDPHPLLNLEKILSEWESEYLSKISHPPMTREGIRAYGELYLKYLWYTQPPYCLHGVSGLRLFLEWHAAKILRDHPDLAKAEVAAELRRKVDLMLPHFPVSDYDIREVIQRLFLQREAA